MCCSTATPARASTRSARTSCGGSRAQPADAAARAGVVPPPPGDRRRGDRRPGRRRRDDAQRHDAGAAAAGRRPAVPLRARLGGPRGRAAARPRPRRPRTRGSAGAGPRGADPRSSRPTCSRSTRCTRWRPRRRSSSSPTRSSRTCPSRARDVPAYRSWIDTAGLRAGLRPPAPDAPAAAVAEAAARRDRRPLGAEDAGPPRLPRRPARAASPTCTSCTCTATRVETIASGRQPQHDAARDARRHRRPAPDRRAVARADGLDQRPGAGHPRGRGGDGSALVTDLQFEDAVADPIGQVGAGVRRDRARADRRGRGGHARLAGADGPARRAGRRTPPETYGLTDAQIRERFPNQLTARAGPARAPRAVSSPSRREVVRRRRLGPHRERGEDGAGDDLGADGGRERRSAALGQESRAARGPSRPAGRGRCARSAPG